MDNENDLLCSSPDMLQLKDIIFSIPKYNNLGLLDGFNSKFYMTYWEIVKEDVLEAIQDFIQGASFIRFYTSSFIVLIPKVKEPQSFDKFFPISLC